MIRRLLLATLFAACAFGQDYRSAEWTAPISTRDTTPGVCRLGQLFIRSDQAAGQNLYVCGSHNDWSLVGGGGGDSLTVPGPFGAVLYSDAGALGGAAIHAATSAEVAGVDVISNGSFTSGLSGWSVSGDGTGWVLDGSGHVHHVPGSNDNYLQQTVNISFGNVYLSKVVVASQTSGSVSLNLGDGCNSDCTGSFTVGINSYAALASFDDGPTIVQVAPSTDSDITVSSVSLLDAKPPLFLPGQQVNSSSADGAFALFSNTSGFSNLANGALALRSNTIGNFNVANGYQSLASNVSGNSNVANGAFALSSSSNGDGNVANGYQSLSGNTTGNYNVAIGYQALLGNDTSSRNVAIGQFALRGNTSGTSNVANGPFALFSNTTGNYNVASGCGALRDSTASNSTVALLSPSLSDACASQSGFFGTQKNASNSILIGTMDVSGINSNSGTPLTNVIAIGGTATQSNQTVIGNSGTLETVIGGGVLRENLHTPASSSEACTAGQFSDDASFHYVCTATNTWKRVALSTF